MFIKYSSCPGLIEDKKPAQKQNRESEHNTKNSCTEHPDVRSIQADPFSARERIETLLFAHACDHLLDKRKRLGAGGQSKIEMNDNKRKHGESSQYMKIGYQFQRQPLQTDL